MKDILKNENLKNFDDNKQFILFLETTHKLPTSLTINCKLTIRNY